MTYLQDAYFSNLNAVYNSGGFFACKSSFCWKTDIHVFDQNKFYCIIEGHCTIAIKDKIYNAKAGDWFFIPAHTPHAYRNDKGDFKKFWLHCDLYPDNDIFSLINIPYLVNYDLNGIVPSLFEKLTVLSKSDLLSDKISIKSILLQLLSEYIKLSYPDGVSVKSKRDNVFDNLLKHINENIGETFSISSLAEKCFLSPNHFIKRFKILTGQTPASYVKRRKIETAKRLLENSDLDISEIAEKIGIYDVSYFCKLFKSFYEKSPKEYRTYYKKHLNG